jgi:hypothetical protein
MEDISAVLRTLFSFVEELTGFRPVSFLFKPDIEEKGRLSGRVFIENPTRNLPSYKGVMIEWQDKI